jgi:hypothetical protein
MPLRAANPSLEQSLMPARHVPIIGIPTCMRTVNERVFHGVNERYPNAVIEPLRWRGESPEDHA